MAALIRLAPTPPWHWTVSFAFPLLLLLPATAAMGAALPAAERFIALNFRSPSTPLGAADVWRHNTFGAVAGLRHHDLSLVPAWAIQGHRRWRTRKPALAAYFAARDRFIRADVGVEETADVGRLIRELREPLLAVVRASPDFSAAYNPLLVMVYRLHRTDPELARTLLRELEQANSLRTEASQLRRRLFLE